MDLDTRKAKADLLRGREVRRLVTSEMECRTYGGRIHFRGLASSTESPYDMGFYEETMKTGAFDTTLRKQPDVQLLVNHEGLPLARTTNGSLALADQGRGLEFDGDAPDDDPDAIRVASKVESGLLDQCSFAFRVVSQEWDGDYTKRDITEVSLDRGDVSIVNYGANPNTSVSLRDAFGSSSDLSDEDLEELRNDPTVITIVRRLNIPPEVIEPVHDLSLYRARAFALSLRN